MSAGRTNKIEVDLKLLQEESLKKLNQFNLDFEKTVDRLNTMVGSWSQQIAGAQGVTGPGKEGPDASTPQKVASSLQGAIPARMGGVNTGGVGGFYNTPPGFGGGFGRGGGPSMPGQPPSGGQPIVPQEDFEKGWVKAQKRIGEHVPVGPRQALGYAAEGLITIPGLSQERASDWNNKLFAMAAVRANVAWANSHLQNIYAGVAVPTALGQQLGASREGLFGTAFMSPAFKKGVSEWFHTGLKSWFGFNPNYSTAQAQEARQTLQSYGYSGATSNWMADRIKSLQIHQGIDAASAMSILDPIMRFGGPESFNQLQEVLKDIPAAARAAKMNLSEFTKALIESANQVAQATGMTPGGATRALNAFSTTTGLNPSRGVDLLSNPRNLMLAAGMTGMSITSLMEGNNRMAPRMAFGLRMFQNATGVPVGELLKLKKTDHARYESIMNGVYMMYENNPQIFGGMSPLEIEHAVSAAGGSEQDLLRHTRIAEQIQAATGTHRAREIDNLLRQWGDHGQMARKFEQAMAGKHHGSANQVAENILAGRQNLNSRRGAQKVTIDLSSEAKKWFSLVNPDKSHSNSGGGFDRPAIGGDSQAFVEHRGFVR